MGRQGQEQTARPQGCLPAPRHPDPGAHRGGEELVPPDPGMGAGGGSADCVCNQERRAPAGIEIQMDMKSRPVDKGWAQGGKERGRVRHHGGVSNSCDPTDCSPPGSSVHGILQARILEWVAIPFSRGSSRPRDQTRSPALQADSLPTEL